MTHLHNIDSTQLLLDAHNMMRYSAVRHLAVREDGNVVGILSVGDLAAYFAWAVGGGGSATLGTAILKAGAV